MELEMSSAEELVSGAREKYALQTASALPIGAQCHNQQHGRNNFQPCRTGRWQCSFGRGSIAAGLC